MEQLAGGGREARDALACLFRAYNPLFVKRLRLFGLAEEDAQETAQDLWMEVARAAPRYERQAPVRFFLLGFLKTAKLRHFSDRKDAPGMDSLSDDEVVSQTEVSLAFAADPASTGPAWLDFVRCVRRAFSVFEREHPRLAKLLVLRHVEEWSLEEVAQQVGGNAERAKAEVYSARRKFEPTVKDCLELWPNRQRGADDASRA
jgi:DNA-directed RNA polymerase specialized sigma24 family protein